MDLEQKVQELQEGIEAGKKAATAVTEVKGEVTEVKTKVESVATEIESVKGDVKSIDESLQDLSKKIDNLKTEKVEEKGFKTAVQEVILSDEFKQGLKDVMEGKATVKRFEIKTDPTSVVTGGLTGDVARTVTPTEIWAPAYEPNKFLAACTPRLVPQDKNQASWFDGTYYSNVGYMSELTAITTGDGAEIVEKYRELAKVGAKLPFSSEVTTDMSYFVNWAQNEARLSVLHKIDELIFEGAGADTTKPKEIYGIKTKGATAFNASTAGLALSISNANLADLIRAAATQVRIQGKGRYNPNLVFLHPSDVAKLYMLKNTRADYIQVLPNGAMSVYGISIAETAKVDAGEMLLVDTSTLQLHQKAGLELEIERVASTDSYVMYLRWRGQVIVPTDAIKANIYVANIATAIASIDAATPTTTAAPTTTVAPTTTGS